MGEGVIDGVDGVAAGLGGEVAVDVCCGGEGGVAKGLGDDGEGDAGRAVASSGVLRLVGL